MHLTHLFKIVTLTGLLSISYLPLGTTALQPIEEAPLATKYQASCRFNKNGTTDCTSEVQYTILKHAGIDQISKLGFSYSERDTFKLISASIVSPTGKSTPLAQTNIDTRMSPNPRNGFLKNKQTSLSFPNLEVGSQILYKIYHRKAAIPFLNSISYVIDFPPKNVQDDHFKIEFQIPLWYGIPMLWRVLPFKILRIISDLPSPILVHAIIIWSMK